MGLASVERKADEEPETLTDLAGGKTVATNSANKGRGKVGRDVLRARWYKKGRDYDQKEKQQPK